MIKLGITDTAKLMNVRKRYFKKSSQVFLMHRKEIKQDWAILKIYFLK